MKKGIDKSYRSKRHVFQLVYMYVLIDRVNESIYMQSSNITPIFPLAHGCVVFMSVTVHLRMSKTERKSQNFAHDT